MSPAECIASLDRALAETGEDIVIRRMVGSGTAAHPVDVACRGFVRTVPAATDAAGPLVQTGCTVTLSPSDVIAGQLPGHQSSGPLSPDPALPKVNDKIIVQGRLRTIIAPARPFFVAGELVRIELTAEG